jgi:hypothetical protein
VADSSDTQSPTAIPHTPGPWHRCEAQPDAIVGPRCTEPCRQCDEVEPKWAPDDPDRTYGDHFGGHFICESVSSRANFNLIAASPDLLIAAKAVLLYTEEPVDFPPLESALVALEAAIRQAEGSDAA